MKTLSCLYVDDESAHQARFGLSIETAWKKLGLNIPIYIDYADSPEAALRKVRERDWNIVVVDILFKEGDKDAARGLQLITTLRAEKGHGLGILALSAEGSWLRDASEAGANETLPKQSIDRDPTLEKLGSVLRSVLLKSGQDPIPIDEVRVRYDEKDLNVKWLIELIGRSTLASIASRILEKRIRSIDVEFVRSGLSGAAVLRLECALDGEGVPVVRKILLKISRDKGQISVEAEKLPRTRDFPFQLFVPPVGRGQLCESGNWYGIGLEFLDRALTLGDWLVSTRATEDKIRNSLPALFGDDGLREVYRRFSRKEEPLAALCEIITPVRGAAILASLDELASVARKYDLNNVLDKGKLNEFVTADYCRQVHRQQRNMRAAYVTLAHGDLHSRNVLVDRNDRFHLVDAGSITDLPWPADIARIFVDIFVSWWDHGAESHEWESLSQWLEVISILLGNGQTDGIDTKGGSNGNVLCALTWLRQNLVKMHPEAFDIQSECEFCLAVSIELLRCSYRRQELPSPKRVLGILAFFTAIERMEKLLADL